MKDITVHVLKDIMMMDYRIQSVKNVILDVKLVTMLILVLNVLKKKESEIFVNAQMDGSIPNHIYVKNVHSNVKLVTLEAHVHHVFKEEIKLISQIVVAQMEST